MRRLLTSTALCASVAGAVWGAPTGGTVSGGTATIDTSVPNVTTITQTSDRALLDWTGFDIGAGETVDFVQPAATSIAINRVSGGVATTLDGTLTANGQVWLLNPAGILVNSGASINVAGLLLAPATLTNDSDVVNGITDVGTFTGGTGNVTVNGAVTAVNQAYAGANAFTFDPTGNGLLTVTSHGTQSVDVGGNLTATGGTVTIRGGSVTLGDGVGLNADNAVTVAASGDLTIANQASTLALPTTGAVTLVADADSNGSGALTMTAGNTLTTQGMLTTSGQTSALANMTSVGAQSHSAAGGVTLNGNLTATGSGNAVAVNNVATLGANATVTTNNGNVTLGSTVDGAHALTLNAGTGAVSVGGAVGGSAALTSFAATGNTVSVGNVTTTGAQTLNGVTTLNGTLHTGGGASSVNGAVTLGGDSSVVLGSGGSYAVNGTVDGAHALTLTAGTGAITLAQEAGASVPLSSLTATGAVSLKDVTTSGAIGSAGATTLGGDLTAGTTLALGGGGTLTAARALTAGTGVSVAGTFGGAYALTLDGGSGDVALTGVSAQQLLFAGGNDALLGGTNSVTGALDFSPLGNVILQNNVVLTGSGAVTLAATNTLSGAHTLDLTGTAVTLGPVSGLTGLTIHATTLALLDNVTTTGAQAYTGPVTLGADVALNAGSGAVTVNNAVDGAHALSVTGGAVTLGGAVGGGTPLTSLSVNGSGIDTQAVTTTGAQTLASTGVLATHGAVDAGTTLNASGVNTTLGGAVQSGGNMVLAGTAALTANGAVDSGGTLDASGGVVALNGTVQSAGAMALTGTTSLATAAAVTSGGTLDEIAPAISIQGATTAAGNATLSGPVTASADVGTTSGNLTLTDALTLGGDVRLFTGGGASDLLTLGNGATGLHVLTLDAGLGNMSVTGDVDVQALAFTAGNVMTFGGGNITVRDALAFGNLGALHLAGDTSIVAMDGTTRAPITATSGNVILATTSGMDLSLTGGVITLYQIGDTGSGKLATLTVDATVANMLGNVYTTGNQTITATQGLAGLLDSHGGDITLNTQATLAGNVQINSGGGNVTLNQPITGGYGMAIDAGGGTVYVNAALGGTGTPLTTLTIDAGLAVLAAAITTSGDQTYNGPVQLATTLTSGGTLALNAATTLVGDSVLAGNMLAVNGALDGGYRLDLQAATTVMAAPAGATTRLGHVQAQGDVTTAGLFADSFGYVGGGALAFNGTGLDVTQGLNIGNESAMPSTLTGVLTSGGAADLRAGNMNVTVRVPSLRVGGGPAILAGQVGGQTGRNAARLVTFSELGAGAHTFGTYGLPLVDDYRLPASFLGSVPWVSTPVDGVQRDRVLFL